MAKGQANQKIKTFKMSLASKRKQYCRRYLNGFATLGAFRQWQKEAMEKLILKRSLFQSETITFNLIQNEFGLVHVLKTNEWVPGVLLTYPEQTRLDALWAEEEGFDLTPVQNEESTLLKIA